MSNRPQQFPPQYRPPGQFPQRPGPPNKGGGNKTLWIVLGVVGGVLALGLIVCAGVLIYLFSAGASVMNEAIEEARTEAKSVAGRNNLKWIGLALHQYHDANRKFPTQITTDDAGNQQSWRAAINPYAGVRDPSLPPALSSDLNGARLFHSPADPGNPNDTSFVAVVGDNTGIASGEGPAKAFRDVLDGTSNTIIVIEVRNSGIPWDQPRDMTIDEAIAAIQNSPDATTNCLFADGKTMPVFKTTSADVLRDLFTVNDGKIHDPSEYLK